MANFLSGKNFQIKISISFNFQKERVREFPVEYVVLWSRYSFFLICKSPLQTPILIHTEKNKFLLLLAGFLKFSMDPDLFLVFL